MMHISMIFDPDACICDAGFFPDGRTDGRTNEQADSRSWISKSKKFTSCSLLVSFTLSGCLISLLVIPFKQNKLEFLFINQSKNLKKSFLLLCHSFEVGKTVWNFNLIIYQPQKSLSFCHPFHKEISKNGTSQDKMFLYFCCCCNIQTIISQMEMCTLELAE